MLVQLYEGGVNYDDLRVSVDRKHFENAVPYFELCP
jgi:hypothetical protein